MFLVTWKVKKGLHYLFPLGRQFTVSLALPGSILDNAQSPELRTYLAGQVTRREAEEGERTHIFVS